MKKILLLIAFNIVLLNMNAKEQIHTVISKNTTSFWNNTFNNQFVKLKMKVRNFNSYEFSMNLSTPLVYKNLKFINSKNNNRFISKNSQMDNRFQNLNLNAESIVEKNKMASISKDIRIKF